MNLGRALQETKGTTNENKKTKQKQKQKEGANKNTCGIQAFS